MYLRTLEIQGFKSFADKTTLRFDSGITAVVGPNGSGKSNIFDAIRWVLGEQSAKALRGSKMEDIIFAGSVGKKPMGLAEVAITLDNSSGLLAVPYGEVTIARRVYRSGESEYLINKSQCRYKDIQDLLLDTGIGRDAQTIIGQGKIDAILSTRAEERRAIFEDAAGVTRFRVRLQDATRKLEETDLNLLRVQDIILELESQLGPMELAAEAARIYKEHARNLREYEVRLGAGRFIARKAELSKQITLSEEAKIKLEERESFLSAGEAKLDMTRLDASITDERVASLQRLIWELTTGIDKTGERLKANNTLISDAKSEKERLLLELGSLGERLSATRSEKADLDGRLELVKLSEKEAAAALAERDSALSASLGDAKSWEDELENLRSEVLDLMSDIAHKRNSLKGLDVERELGGRRVSELQEKLQNLCAEISYVTSSCNEKLHKRSQSELQVSSLKSKLSAIEASIVISEREIKDLENKERNLARELDSKGVRHKVLTDLSNSYEGYNYGVKAVLTDFIKTSAGTGIVGTVADLLRVEKRLEKSIEVALGGAIQNIVTRDSDTAKGAIEYLKSRKAGRVTFLPLDMIRGGRIGIEETARLSKMDGIIGVAVDLIEFSHEYKSAFENLLGRTVIAQNLDAAVKASKAIHSQYRFVTLDGEVISAGGSMTGGADGRNQVSLLARKRELDELMAEETRLRRELEIHKSHENDVKATINDFKTQAAGLRNELDERVQALSELDVEISFANKEKLRFEKELHDAERDLTALTTNTVSLADAAAGLEDVIKKDENRRLTIEAKIQEIQDALKDGQAIREELASASMEVKLSLASKQQELLQLEKDGSRLVQAEQEMQSRINAIRIRYDDTVNRLIQLEKEKDEDTGFVGSGSESRSKYEIDLAEASKTKELMHQTIADLERETKSVAKVVADIRAKCHGHELAVARLETELADLEQQLTVVYSIDLPELDAIPPLAEGEERELEKVISVERAYITGLGDVNPMAEEEFNRTKERRDFLTKQRDDLVEAQDGLKRIISETKETAEQKFLETFSKIQVEFTRIFAQLFQSGTASLYLSDSSDVLGSGIEIQAQPPGKKLQSLTLLSGGERALAAIAVLFAVLQVRPNPFCVLDEIDAALDEVNVSRFAELLKECAEESQIVIVTHRKGTMKFADCLYGVTMEDNGISKVLSLNLQEATA